ncbi:MAG TPA: hypothetical protein VG818_09525, partial [Gemmatimonadaceae bacterium]|nr:hypothetical protein [Gemmatimonadaceae bacterium]
STPAAGATVQFFQQGSTSPLLTLTADVNGLIQTTTLSAPQAWVITATLGASTATTTITMSPSGSYNPTLVLSP